MAPQFRFVALEFTSSLGPPPGRYPVAAGGPPDRAAQDALLISVVGAAAPQPRIFRRAKPADPTAARREVSLLRVTWVQTSAPIERGGEARRQLAAMRPEAEREALIEHALITLNRAIRAYAIAAGDPFAHEVSRFDPREVQVGVATGAEIDDGTFTGAFACPFPSRGRPRLSDRLRPGEAVYDVLTARTRTTDAELHLLRVLLDLDQGRAASARLELEAATDLLIRELDAFPSDLVAQYVSGPIARAEQVTSDDGAGLRAGNTHTTPGPPSGDEAGDVLAATLALIEGTGRLRAAARST